MALADQALLSAHRARWKRIGLVGAGPTTLAGGLRYLHLADRSRNPGPLSLRPILLDNDTSL
ncbi:hypothetical protein BHQ23_12515 [Mycobacterium gordonae]|uniref:Uncharacterized protein n=1 Tax=Mycobacterium gordonae TaxID=1778 RepID=A0A1A6BA25_MYCGO|nr:hypothetical protein A9W98_31700 [Mycobacterium gordonae]ODR21406.1 hypothetical protein BHQ23_12515 [Mycobacterium gordonae]ORV95674.1 hypothetical protein AWC08_14475 [Mycobacterium gordonae]